MAAMMIVCLVCLLAGCASKPLPSSGPREPIPAGQVRFYQNYPKQCEQVRMIRLALTPEMKWDERADANAAFEALKPLAAAAGANGIVFKAPAADYEYLVTAGYHGTFYQVPMLRQPKTIVAEAVFVLEE
jgi:hypothetical protein